MAITGAVALHRPLPFPQTAHLQPQTQNRGIRTITIAELLRTQQRPAKLSSNPFHVSSPLQFRLSAGRPVVLSHPTTHLICRASLASKPPSEQEDEEEALTEFSDGQGPPRSPNKGDGEGDSGGAMAGISSAFIFVIWAAFFGYCSFFSPNYTPATDKYLLEKLLNLRAGDGYEVNQVLFSLWNIMGLWPAIYTMLLIPSGRSARSKTPVWPFTTLSFFAGAFALLPYFGLWQPPPPKLSKEEIEKWPLKIIDSKILAIAVAVPGAILVAQAILAGSESWEEFLRYFNSSRFIHIMSLDFLALCSFAPFWVFNDIEVRKRSKDSSWAAYLSFIPLIGPALYLALRPSLKGDDVTL